MERKLSLGSVGEAIAKRYLENLGYRSLYRNYLIPGLGEIDLVMRSPEGVLVCVEVKTLRVREGSLQPEDNVSRAKLEKMRRAAEVFSAKHPELVWGEAGICLDVVTVAFPGTGLPDLTKSEKDCTINHYRNVAAG
jgi:Holliday junction resolvase-like predicted endonuclease